MPKSPLRLLKRRNRAAFDSRSSSERSPNGEVVRKPLYGGPWIGYPVRARTAKKEILVKSECIRPGVPLTPEDARRLIERYVEHYNTVRLHSAIRFVTPADLLAGRPEEIHAARDRKLEQAREQRQLRRRQAA